MPKLLIDENLTRLARWCRFLGFDVLSPSSWNDSAVSSRARAEDRILISRDRELCAHHRGPCLRIHADHFPDQLHELLRACGPTAETVWFSRCVECNVELRILSAEERVAHALVPENWKQADCWECAGCGRAYWHGSHFERTRSILRAAVARASA